MSIVNTTFRIYIDNLIFLRNGIDTITNKLKIGMRFKNSKQRRARTMHLTDKLNEKKKLLKITNKHCLDIIYNRTNKELVYQELLKQKIQTINHTVSQTKILILKHTLITDLPLHLILNYAC